MSIVLDSTPRNITLDMIYEFYKAQLVPPAAHIFLAASFDHVVIAPSENEAGETSCFYRLGLERDATLGTKETWVWGPLKPLLLELSVKGDATPAEASQTG